MGARAASTEQGSPGGSSSPAECGLCACAIDGTEECCQATCKAGCRSCFHLPCITKSVEQAIRAGMAGSRQRKFGEVMLSKITKRPAEAVKEWLRRPPQPICPTCHVAPLEAAHVHKPSSAKAARHAAPAAAAWAPAAHPLPRTGGRSAGGPRGSGHPWQGSGSFKPGPAAAPARVSSFAAEQERLFKEQQAREASLRREAAARKVQQAAQNAARVAASQQGEAGQAAAQPAEQGQSVSSAGAPAQQEGTVLLSGAALDLMRGHKRRGCARSLRDMGFGVNECLQATVAWGGEAESAAAALLEGRTPPVLIATSVAREARELVQAGSRLGLAPAAVEAVLVALDGDWEQAQRQLRHQVEAASAASSAAAPHIPSSHSLGGVDGVGAAGAESLSRSTSASVSTGLTPAQAIYAYAGAYIGGSSDWGSTAADAVAAGQYGSLEAEALTTAGSLPAPGQQQGEPLHLWDNVEAAVEPAAAAEPYLPEPAVMSEDSARWWAGTSGGAVAGKVQGAAPAAPAGWPVQSPGVQQQQRLRRNDEAEVADLMELLGLGGLPVKL